MRIAWVCSLSHYVRVDPAIGGDPANAFLCPQCAGSVREGAAGAYISAGEAITIMRGPDGEVRIPGQPDSPMTRKYESWGFQREVINTHEGKRALERETGFRHERSHFDAHSAAADRYYNPPPPPVTSPVLVPTREGGWKLIRPEGDQR